MNLYSFFNLIILLAYLMCMMFCLHLCLHATCMPVTMEVRREHQIPLVTEVMSCQELNSDPLEEQEVL